MNESNTGWPKNVSNENIQRGNNLHARDERLEALRDWLVGHVKAPMQALVPLHGDASFRRYFRVHCGDTSYIAMDAPPDKESCESFVLIAKAFRSLGLNVPVIYGADISRGFLLLSDFGDQLYLETLSDTTADTLYQSAFDDLLLLQSCQKVEGYVLPSFTADAYRQEMLLFKEWYLKRHLQLTLSSADEAMFERVMTVLIDDALLQPQVCIHRDYHSRNLMVVGNNKQPGMLDFQDAMKGPITYDLLSLLRDCYIDWPVARVEKWVLTFQKQALQTGLLPVDDPLQFLRWFDWIGLQRNLKCIGLFVRLQKRDNKCDYMRHIPRIIRYASTVCDRYEEFSDLKSLLKMGEGRLV